MSPFQSVFTAAITTVLFALGSSVWAQETNDSQTAAEKPKEETAEAPATEATPAAAASTMTAESATTDHVLGDPNAPLTIVEYASFTCPHCMDFEKTVWPNIQKDYIDTGKAKLIYREVYFDGAGLLAASLARCVPAEQYYPMVFTLYDTNEAWLKTQKDVEGMIAELTKLGVMAGLPKDTIAACLDNRDVQEKMIENSTKHMQEDNVKGTPTVIVGGEAVGDWGWENLGPLLERKYEEATK